MTEHTFEIYKLMVEEVREAKKARRELSNVFMTLNLAGVGALGFLARGESGLDPALFAWCAIALTLMCIIWRTSNSYYTLMLAAKYKGLYELEHRLGISVLQNEYATIHGKRSAMKWFSLERAMPLLFIVGYIVFLAYQTSMAEVQQMFDAVTHPVRDVLARFGVG